MESSFKGFNRVNLIGGKNNAGKTALLEALLINYLPANGAVRLLQRFRDEDDKTAKKYPERTWENLFFNQQKNQNIIFNSTDSNGYNSIVELRYDENIEDFIKYVDEKENDSENENMEFAQLKNSVANSTNSALYIDTTKNGENMCRLFWLQIQRGLSVKVGVLRIPV